jgi:hypothetical protein
VPDSHPTVPVPMPDLSHLTHSELTALRSYFTAQSRDLRRKAIHVMGKYPSIKGLWLKTVALPTGASQEERDATLVPFHREVLRFPDAFFLYAWANTLVTLDKYLWDAMVERSKIEGPKKKSGKP